MTTKDDMPSDAKREFEALAERLENYRRWFRAQMKFLDNGWRVFVDALDTVAPEDKLELILRLKVALAPTFEAMGPAPPPEALTGLKADPRGQLQ